MNPDFLTKVAEFISLAIENNKAMKTKIMEQQKQAVVKDLDAEKRSLEIQKAADALYDSDYLTSEAEKKLFLRKAAEDQIYVIRMLVKMAEANDVAQLGRPAKVSARDKSADFDPVYEAAFGRPSSNIVDD